MARTSRWLPWLSLVAFTLSLGALADPALAKTVTIPKKGAKCADDQACHNRWHPAIKPAATADPGDTVVFGTRDAFDHTFTRTSVPADVTGANLNLVHPLTGPLFVNGAEAGDVLAVTIGDIVPDKFGYTVIVPGFGFLRDLFPNPHIVRWDLTRSTATSPDMPGVKVRFNGFTGTIGTAPGPKETDLMFQREDALMKAGGFVLPPEPKDALPVDVCGPAGSNKDRCLRTIPPRENGGNMDVKQMVKGTTLLLPCFVKGCLLSIGDVHFAQGDGEVCGTAIEAHGRVTIRVDVLPAAKLGHRPQTPAFESVEPAWKGGRRHFVTTGLPIRPDGSNADLDTTLAARNALLSMIDWLGAERGLSREQAYVLCSVAVDLRISEIVDIPNPVVSALCPLDIFHATPPRRTG